MIEKNDPRLTAYVLNELDDKDRAEIDAAVQQSEELQKEINSIRQATTMLAEHLPAEACPQLTPNQRTAIREQTAAASDGTVPVSAPASAARKWVIAAVALAATVLLAVFVVVNDNTRRHAAMRTLSPGGSSNESSDGVPMDHAGRVSSSDESHSGLRDYDLAEDAGDMPAEMEEQYSAEMAPRSESNFGPAQADYAVIGPAGQTPVADPIELDPSDTDDAFRAPANQPGGFGGKLGADSSFGASRAGRGEVGGGGSARASNPFGNRPNTTGSPAPSAPAPSGPAPSRPAPPVSAEPTPDPSPSRFSDQRGGIPGDNTTRGVPAATPLPREPQPTSSPDAAADEFAEARPGEKSRIERMLPADDGAVRQVVEAPTAATPEPRDAPLPEGERLARADSNQPTDTPKLAQKPSNDTEKQNESASAGKSETKQRTWKRARATPNASRLMIGDHDELPMEGMQVNVMVDGFRARVLMDLYFYNDRAQQLEGSFKLRLPNEASLYYFAFGQTSFEYKPMVDSLATKGFLTPELVRASGTGPKQIFQARSATWKDVKEARVVPREKAAHAYSEVVRRRVDPALVEWAGAGVFNTKVFPLQPNKLHRIVVGYDVNLNRDGDDLVYNLDLPKDLSQCSVDLDVSALPGAVAEVTPATRPFVSAGRAFYHFNDPAVKKIDVRFKQPGTVLLSGGDAGTGKYFATRITPELPAGEQHAGSPHAIFVVDTSLSSNPDKFNVWLKMMETILAENRDAIEEFAVLCFSIDTHWWKKGYVKNTPDNVNAALNYCGTLALEGATDVRQALAEAVQPSWTKDDEKTPRADLFLLSDGAATWGETDVRQIATALQGGSGGTLFAYNTGLTGTAIGQLDFLARETGGSVFSVASENEVKTAATAHRSRPWRLLNVAVDGGSDLLIAGRPQFIYPGQTLQLVGRGTGAEAVHVHLRRGGDDQMLTIPVDRNIESELAARIYGQVAVGQLEDLGAATEEVSVAYARHFRVTGQTCSLLMLESEADYQRFNIKPEDDIFVVKSSPADGLILRKTDELAEKLTDPKEATKAWLAKMERTPGVQFVVPTALRLMVDRLPDEAFEVDLPRLVAKRHDRDDIPKKVFQHLSDGRLDYHLVSAEAARRLEKYGSPDALKALSSLVETSPGDTVIAGDVAFTAIHWGLGAQAYPLLKRVAAARPYLPHLYQATAQCLAELGNADLAMIYYEVALTAQWNARYRDFGSIVRIEYLHLLQRINNGELKSHAVDFALARLETLTQNAGVAGADLIVTMMWNTDRTDVDLHVLEPNGEECFYKNPRSRSGGNVTRDVTEGFGPEMYTINQAPAGRYKIMANYFGSDANRTQVRTKVYVTVYKQFGTKQESVSRHAITLSENKEKRELVTVNVEK